MKAITLSEVNNDKDGHGYTIPRNTKVEVLSIQLGTALIRGPGIAYSPNMARKTTVVVSADLSQIEEHP